MSARERIRSPRWKAVSSADVRQAVRGMSFLPSNPLAQYD
jgi:hypothetical protein